MENLPNLLIVDDTEENLIFLENIIRKTKVNLIRALSGAEALEKTHGIELALAIIDVNMPFMDGYELAGRMNNERMEDKVPLIFITASHIKELDALKGYDYGAVDYIFKPFNYTFLQSKINVFLDLYHQKQKICRDAKLLKESAEELVRVNEALKKSEKKYRSYIDNAPDGVFIADETGKYIEVNKAASRITGYLKDELVKMSISEILTENSMADGLASFKEVVDTGSSNADLSFRHKSGTTRWWSIQAVKLSEKRFLGFTKDITQRIKLEESLRTYQAELEMQNEELMLARSTAQAAAEKYTELYDFAPSGYFTLSEETAIDELNLSGAQILGLDRSHLINKHFDLFVSIKSLSLFHDFFRKVFTSKTKETCEITLESKGHQSKYVHVEGILGGNGKQCLVNVVDITRRKQAENALRESEELFKSVVHNSHDLTTLTDAEGKVTFVSPQCESVIGYPPEKLTGKLIPDFIHPDDAERCKLAWNQVHQGIHALREFEYRILDSQGVTRWVSHSAKLLKINGIVLGIQNTIRNITARKKAEEAIKVSEGKYRTMLNASPDGIFLIDMKGIITEVSEIGLELFGADNKEDLVGKDFYQFVPSDEKKALSEIFERTMSEGLTQNIGLKITKKNQTLFAAETSATLIQGPDGAPLSFMFIIRDISQRKKMETKQIHADRMANLGQMAAGIAHEINQPLNIISMVMDKILFESAKTDSINLDFLKKKSDKIFENITRMRNIIDHIRAFSRSHEEYVLTAFDINTSIENATSMITEQFKHIGINLSVQLDKQLPLILGNTYKFEQVILNLLVNAKDAVMEKKNKLPDFVEMNVDVISYSENKLLVVEIKDNGIGISGDDIQHIILPFYTTKDEGKGTGLGLTICYQIIKEMGGTIEIISDGSHGTKIKLFLEDQKKK